MLDSGRVTTVASTQQASSELEVPWDALACPACLGSLDRRDLDLHCQACGQAYRATEAGQPDLRLRSPKKTTLTLLLGQPNVAVPEVTLEANPNPQLDLTGFTLPPNISPRLASYIPRASRPGARALDLGCGTTRTRELLEHAGYEYVGIDFNEPEAQLLADGHALPFADSTFDLILTIAVIEYFRYPHVAMREAYRALRDGGYLMGNVGFLLPFLPDTHFHHTHFGILSTLAYAGFDTQMLLLDRNWTALEATGAIGLFPRLPAPLVRAIIKPLKALHIAWWRAGRRFTRQPLTDTDRLLRITADIEFLARKGMRA